MHLQKCLPETEMLNAGDLEAYKKHRAYNRREKEPTPLAVGAAVVIRGLRNHTEALALCARS